MSEFETFAFVLFLLGLGLAIATVLALVRMLSTGQGQLRTILVAAGFSILLMSGAMLVRELEKPRGGSVLQRWQLQKETPMQELERILPLPKK